MEDDDRKSQEVKTETEDGEMIPAIPNGRYQQESGEIELIRPLYSNGAPPDKDESLKAGLSAFGSCLKQSYCPRRTPYELAASFLPPLAWLRTYPWKTDLVSDLLAGLTVGCMAVPEGLAYAKLAGMPPVYGLYTNTIPSLVYILLGTSKHAIFGPITAISLLISVIRYKYIPCEDCWQANGTSSTGTTTPGDGGIPGLTPIELGSTVAFIVGVYLILMGICRLSFVTRYLSDPVIGGFTVGVAVQVAAGQLESIFGINPPKRNGIGKAVMNFYDLFRLIGHTNVVTFLIFLPCFVFLLLVKAIINPRLQPKLRFPFPGELLVVIGGTLASYYGNVNGKYGVKIVNTIPAGLPKPVLPRFDLIPTLWADSIAPTVVTYALSISLGKLFAKRNGYKVDPTQEFYAYGFMNLFGSFFQCIDAGQSMARSMVCERSGGKTQVCALVAVIVGVIVILVIGPFMETLPSCVLSSVVVSACVMVLVNIRETKTLYRMSKLDLLTYVITAIGVIGLDVTYGLAAGVICALLTVILRAQKAKVRLLDSEANLLWTSERSDRTQQSSKFEIRIVRLDSALFYASVEEAKLKLYGACNDASWFENHGGEFSEDFADESGSSGSSTKPRMIILDFAGVTFIDSMGLSMLKEVSLELGKRDVDILISQCNDSLRRLLNRNSVLVSNSPAFPSLLDAITYTKTGH